QHQRLAGRDGALRALEAHPHAAVVQHFDLAGLVRLPVAGLRGAGEARGRRRAGDPVRRFAAQLARLQPRAVVALIDVEDVAVDVLADHEPRRLRAAAHAADVQALALAEGEIEHPRMFADAGAGRVADLAGPGRQVARQEFAEIALADEADAGGILFRRSAHAVFRRDPSHLVLVQSAQREACRRQLFLAELVQEIALVLAAVLRPQQAEAAARSLDPRVMAGGDGVGAELAGGVEEML